MSNLNPLCWNWSQSLLCSLSAEMNFGLCGCPSLFSGKPPLHPQWMHTQHGEGGALVPIFHDMEERPAKSLKLLFTFNFNNNYLLFQISSYHMTINVTEWLAWCVTPWEPAPLTWAGAAPQCTQLDVPVSRTQTSSVQENRRGSQASRAEGEGKRKMGISVLLRKYWVIFSDLYYV